MTPPLLVKGLEPKKPPKKRVTRSVARFCARAGPMLNNTKGPYEMRKSSLRPRSSLSGAHNKGPNAKPHLRVESESECQFGVAGGKEIRCIHE